jgi:hypothetical protein
MTRVVASWLWQAAPSRLLPNAIVPRRCSKAVNAAMLAVALAAGLPGGALAHGPDPALGSTSWAPNQTLAWAWASAQVPPSWLQTAFERGTADSNATRASRAGVFVRQSSAPSRVAYGEPTGCSPAGIACFSRSVPSSFRIWFRAHGYRFDWGTLRWCQGPSGFVDGCFDVENIALDELGHVLGLGHHLNYSDDRDYRDAVVQTVSRTKPRAGWDAHAYGRCDVARLQLIYDRLSTWAGLSTCLSVATTLGLTSSASSAWLNTQVQMTATLRTASSSAYGALSNDPVSGRTVMLDRRSPGASSWTTVATMAATGEGTYAATVTITGVYEWRARFPKPGGEGLGGSTSAWVPVSILRCTTCPAVLSTGGRP